MDRSPEDDDLLEQQPVPRERRKASKHIYCHCEAGSTCRHETHLHRCRKDARRDGDAPSKKPAAEGAARRHMEKREKRPKKGYVCSRSSEECRFMYDHGHVHELDAAITARKQYARAYAEFVHYGLPTGHPIDSTHVSEDNSPVFVPMEHLHQPRINSTSLSYCSSSYADSDQRIGAEGSISQGPFGFLAEEPQKEHKEEKEGKRPPPIPSAPCLAATSSSGKRVSSTKKMTRSAPPIPEKIGRSEAKRGVPPPVSGEKVPVKEEEEKIAKEIEAADLTLFEVEIVSNLKTVDSLFYKFKRGVGRFFVKVGVAKEVLKVNKAHPEDVTTVYDKTTVTHVAKMSRTRDGNGKQVLRPRGRDGVHHRHRTYALEYPTYRVAQVYEALFHELMSHKDIHSSAVRTGNGAISPGLIRKIETAASNLKHTDAWKQHSSRNHAQYYTDTISAVFTQLLRNAERIPQVGTALPFPLAPQVL